ncbi:MAG: prepilin peptidase [Bryobacteraceae bacterium]
MTTWSPAEIAHLEMWITAAVGVGAAIEDLLRRTISNWFCLAALAGGAVCQCLANGWTGLGWAALGATAGFAVFLVFYLLGGMGGGDVKLMSGFGALLGVSRLWKFAFWTALTGGILAAVVLGIAAIRARSRSEKTTGKTPVAIPYAPAIVLGVWLTLLSSQ